MSDFFDFLNAAKNLTREVLGASNPGIACIADRQKADREEAVREKQRKKEAYAEYRNSPAFEEDLKDDLREFLWRTNSSNRYGRTYQKRSESDNMSENTEPAPKVRRIVKVRKATPEQIAEYQAKYGTNPTDIKIWS